MTLTIYRLEPVSGWKVRDLKEVLEQTPVRLPVAWFGPLPEGREEDPLDPAGTAD